MAVTSDFSNPSFLYQSQLKQSLMPGQFQFKVELTNNNPAQLILAPTATPTFIDSFEPLKAWLKGITEFSQIQAEQGADWFQIRFYFQTQPFYLHFEHYSDCYWIDADSQAGLVLLSQLAEFITRIEQNHTLSQP